MRTVHSSTTVLRLMLSWNVSNVRSVLESEDSKVRLTIWTLTSAPHVVALATPSASSNHRSVASTPCVRTASACCATGSGRCIPTVPRGTRYTTTTSGHPRQRFHSCDERHALVPSIQYGERSTPSLLGVGAWALVLVAWWTGRAALAANV